MGKAYEILTGRVTNAGATFTALTMATGDSLSVRSADINSPVMLEDVWGLGATAGIIRVRSPRLHDNVQGIRLGYTAATPQPLMPDEVMQKLYPQDQLIVEMTGGGAETDMASLLVYYADIPGLDARLETWESLVPQIEQYVSVESQLTTGGTAGDYGGSQAINANFDLLKANTRYAILGYISSVAVLSVGVRSPDFGNLRVGGPGTTQRLDTRDWFIRLSQTGAGPHIPVFNSTNKGSTFVDVVHSGAGTAVTVQFMLAQLRGLTP